MSSLLDPRREAEASAADDLERLWAASPDAAPAPARETTPEPEPLLAELPPRVRYLRQVVGWGWPAFLLFPALLAPAGAEDVQRAAWVDPAAWSMLLLVLLGYFALVTFPRAGFGLFAAAAVLGVALGIDCRVSAHHLGAWWIAEAAVAAGLAAAALAGVLLLSRR